MLARLGDVRATIEALLPQLEEKHDRSRVDRAREHIVRRVKALIILLLAGMASRRYTRSKLPRQSAILPLMMRSLPAMLACDGLGRPVFHNEWQAAPHRILLAWIEGQCDGAGD
jgi:hypothetical protein